MFHLHKCRKPKNSKIINDIINVIDIAEIDIHNDTLDLTMYNDENSSKILYYFSKELYVFEKYKSESVHTRNIKVLYSCRQEKVLKDVLKQIECANISRNIANEPANKMYPAKFCTYVGNIFKAYPFVTVKILDTKDLEKKGMNLIVATGQGSTNKPFMCIIEMNKAKENICLVGKGVCFDAGGIDIKPRSYGMNIDKTGASCVVGIMKYFCDNKKYKKKSMIGIIPLSENMPDGNSLKPNDIIKAYNGMSVEIVNTDAEGRLLLADAISYSCDKYNPSYIFDFATLTGDASYRHFAHSYMTYTENENISRLLENSCETKTGERGIRMPPWSEYMVYTKSKVADIQNLDHVHREGGEFMAAMFLRNFLPKDLVQNWIHFDIGERGQLSKCNGMYSYIELLKRIS